MNIQQFLTQLNQDDMSKLAQTETADQLRKLAAKLGYSLTSVEAETAYAALYPMRDGSLSDDVLEAVCGGIGINTPSPSLYSGKTPRL